MVTGISILGRCPWSPRRRSHEATPPCLMALAVHRHFSSVAQSISADGLPCGRSLPLSCHSELDSRCPASDLQPVPAPMHFEPAGLHESSGDAVCVGVARKACAVASVDQPGARIGRTGVHTHDAHPCSKRSLHAIARRAVPLTLISLNRTRDS